MRQSRAGEAAFVGRTRLLANVRSCIASGLHVWVAGESGVGKTALARRACSDALYLPNATPTKELLVNLLLELWKRGLYSPGESEDEDEADENTLGKRLRRLDLREAQNAACQSLKEAHDAGESLVLIVDEFDTATATTVRIVKTLGAHITLVCCAGAARPSQKGFLFGCTRFDVPRLSALDTGHLAEKLLDDYGDSVPAKERPRLVRQIVEQSQGLPSITRELVKRAAAHGDLSTRGVRREDLHGAKPLDMTPGIVIAAILFVGARVAVRPMNDADMTVLFGFSGAILMLVRLFAMSAAGRGGRR